MHIHFSPWASTSNVYEKFHRKIVKKSWKKNKMWLIHFQIYSENRCGYEKDWNENDKSKTNSKYTLGLHFY